MIDQTLKERMRGNPRWRLKLSWPYMALVGRWKLRTKKGWILHENLRVNRILLLLFSFCNTRCHALLTRNPILICLIFGVLLEWMAILNTA